MNAKILRSLAISQDSCPPNPRTDYEPMCKIAAFKRGYGDEVLSDEEIYDIRHDDDYFSRRVYIMDRSGVSLSLTPYNDRWDSGQLGIIYISKVHARKEFEGETEEALVEKIENAMTGEIALYNMYLSGSCYYGVLTERKEIEFEGEKYFTKSRTEDSIGGIYAEYSDILPEFLSTLGLIEEDFDSITVLDIKIK